MAREAAFGADVPAASRTITDTFQQNRFSMRQPKRQVKTNTEGDTLDDLYKAVGALAGFLRRPKSSILETLVAYADEPAATEHEEGRNDLDFLLTLGTQLVNVAERVDIVQEPSMSDAPDSVYNMRGYYSGLIEEAMRVVGNTVPVYSTDEMLVDALVKDDTVAARWLNDVCKGRCKNGYEAVYETVPLYVPSGPPPSSSDWMLDDVSTDKCLTMSRYLGSAESWKEAHDVANAKIGGPSEDAVTVIKFRDTVSTVGRTDVPIPTRLATSIDNDARGLLAAWGGLTSDERESALVVVHAIHHAALKRTDEPGALLAQTTQAGCHAMRQVVPKVHPTAVKLAMQVGQEAWPWKNIAPCFSMLEMENIDRVVETMVDELRPRAVPVRVANIETPRREYDRGDRVR